MVTVGGEGKNYWPGWRGPSAQGYVVGSGYPDKWSDTENVLWKVEVAGAGNSSPIVWGNRIFLATPYDGGKGPVKSFVQMATYTINLTLPTVSLTFSSPSLVVYWSIKAGSPRMW